MAIDVYLQIDGVKGESHDDMHKDWIEVTGIHWGYISHAAQLPQPLEATLRSAPSCRIFRSPSWQTCPARSSLRPVRLDERSPRPSSSSSARDGNGARVKYFQIELENVLVGMVKLHLGGDQSFLTETVNLKYSKIKWKYTQQRIGGGVGGNTAGGWDLAANKIV
jgi:type VI secretion system secreted protein Hcp